MISIKIDDKKYKIKTIEELTTREYIDVMNIQDLDLLKYIALQANVNMDKVFFAVVSDTVRKLIGQIEAVEKMKIKHVDYIDMTKKIETVGQRLQIEDSNKTGGELLVYLLAVSQARDNNIDKVNKLYDEYMTKPWDEILPAGFFFFRILRSGNNYVVRSFVTIITFLKMKLLGKWRELIS